MFFEKLKELRDYDAKTQKETATLLGVKRSTYAGWECGKDIIPLTKLNDLANIYKVSLDYLVGLTDTPQKRKENINIDLKIVSDNIKMLRLANHLTQEELGQNLKISQANIHKYENQKALITTMNAIMLAKKYQYSLDKLLENPYKK